MLSVALLGLLEVTVDGTAIRLTSARQRSILALLALDAGQVVAVDRIVDAVWGDDQPADGTAALHTQVSRLRSLLGPDRIVTRDPGYMLADAQVDVQRFAELVRRAGDEPPAEAKRLLTEALALWRGPALADLGDAPSAVDARRALEDARRDAVEARGRARVELGHYDAAIAELRGLVADDPYRERAWAALMLALYRAGRQADALDAYAEARRISVADLGLEPAPALRELQAQVLAQDPALDAPALRRRRRRRATVAGIALAAAVGAAATALALSGGAEDAGEATTGGQVLRLDATTGEVRARTSVGRAPGPLAVGAGATWVVDTDAQTITAIGDDVRTFSTGRPPLDVAATRDALYVGTGAPSSATQIAGPVVDAVQRLTPSTQTVRATVALGHRSVERRPPERQLALVDGTPWTIRADGSLARVDAADRVGATVSGLAAIAVAAGPAGLWAIEEDGTVARIDPRAARVVARTRLEASSLGAIAVGRGEVWVSAPDDGAVWRVPAGDVHRAQRVPLARGVRAVGVGAGAVWVANPLVGTLTRIDERSGRVTGTVHTGGHPQDVVVAGRDAWASVAPGPAAASTEPGTIAGAPCEPTLARPGDRADVMLVSDLPLRGGIRVSSQHMTEAIAAVVRARGFRAGRFKVAYASCDDSIARTGIFDATRCATNARAYIRDPRVLGVVGALNSPCTRAAMRELPAGGPVYVSPFSTDPALTQPARARPFARVIATDAAQAAGLALLARRLGAARVYLIDDRDPAYGGMLAGAFRRAAARLGVPIVGAGSWNPRAPRPAGLARAAARLHPDAVVVAGTIDDGGTDVVRELRGALGPQVRLLLTDGFTPTDILARRAGRAADGAYVSLASATLDALTPSGRRLARTLRRSSVETAEDPGAFYAAQAATVLLDAIARSDGSRASVLREVRRTDVAEGLLGPVRFDASGDLAAPAVTVLRARLGDRSRPDFEDARVDQVLRPPASLLAP
jgi:DNA-binding SARP family transcriptional activator/ABC-type branched-subunit amino acid transport system substrate-binding protein